MKRETIAAEMAALKRARELDAAAAYRNHIRRERQATSGTNTEGEK